MADVRREQGGGPGAGVGRAGSGWHDVRIPGYEAFAVLGRGGHAVVVKARQLSVNRTVAIKLLVKAGADERTRRRFDHERAAMGRLDDHPNIVLVVDSGFRDDGVPYLVMEYLAGGSLAAAVERDGPFGWQRAVDIGVKLAGALETANQRRVLHRDVKPENVLFSTANEPKLADFGIARAVGGIEGAGATGLSVSQAAPETFEARFSPRSDVYSLASSIMTVILGRPPFVRGDEEVLPIGRICNEPPPNLRRLGVPRVVCEVLERAMAKDPADRQGSAAMFGEELRRAQAATGMKPTTMIVLPPKEPPEGLTADPPTMAPPIVPTLTAPVPVASAPPSADQQHWSMVPTSDEPLTSPQWASAAPSSPTPVPHYAEVRNSGPPAPPAPPAPRAPLAPPPAPPAPPATVVIYRPNRRPPARRTSGLRSAVILFVCVAVIAAGTVAAAAYARSGYFVGADGLDVVIYKGRPGGFLFFSPRPAEPTTVAVNDLEAEQAVTVNRGVRAPSLATAREYVSSLRTTTTTTAATAATSTTTPTTPANAGSTGSSASPPSAPAATVISDIGPVRAGPAVVPSFEPTLRLTLGEGWSTTVKPVNDLFEIRTADGNWVLSFWAISEIYAPASKPITEDDAVAAVSEAPGDVFTWLSRHPQLRVSNTTVGPTPPGATSLRQFDATVAGGYNYQNCTATCLLLFRLQDRFPAVKLVSERTRFYVISTPRGTIVASASTKQNNLDALTAQVAPIMRSLLISG